jgi:hypothetical protein
MQFKYPELLYALFLLLIPILIHLFQLRKFEKIAFTNVEFLKKVKIQTRKSSKLKKYLILLSRLLLFAALIFAFTQPYLSKNKTSKKPKTILYLDNSLSMQAKDGTNELFKNAVQEIISTFSNTQPISVLTNTNFYKNLSDKELKNQLLSLDYSAVNQDFNTTLLKTSNLLKSNKNIDNHVILLSDFQTNNFTNNIALDSLTKYTFVQVTPQKKENISIDSVFISNLNAQKITLKVRLKSYHTELENLSISLFKDNILIGKTSTTIANDKTTDVTFDFPFNDNFNGIIKIEDNLLDFDNTFYFSINKLEKVNVLSIGNENEFLSKIYSENEFNFLSKKINQLDYNQLKEQHLIILNELDLIPISLQEILNEFIKNGGSLVVIPSSNIDLLNYNQFFNLFKAGVIGKKNKQENKVTTINFTHPILANVFEKQISNFQYPNVKSSYQTNFNNASAILNFNNQRAFITQLKINIKKSGKLYFICSSINNKNSNFKNSPLIVPVFYNFGKQSFNITQLYYTIGNTNNFEIKTKLKKDAILKIKNDSYSFIPLQQINQNSVKITTEENPLIANHYTVFNEDVSIKNIAFNYNRSESETNYLNLKSELKDYKNVTFSTNINQAFEQINDQYKTNSLWKWFIILALLFLIIEILLIKFWKK